MTRIVWLRISSIILVLFAVGHTIGGFKKWSPMGDNAVLNTMADVHFQTYGVSRSYLDFFMGFGWSLSAGMMLQAVLLWQMSKLAAESASIVRSMIAVFILSTLASVMISWAFLFPTPALFSVVLLVPLICAFLAKR